MLLCGWRYGYPGRALVTDVFTGDGLKLYVDGVLVDSESFSVTSLSVNAKDLLIGGDSYRYFNGLIDDVRVYSTALSGVDVGQLYSDTVGDHTEILPFGARARSRCVKLCFLGSIILIKSFI